MIVSADGMIADAKGQMPPSIRNEADQRFFQDALDRAAAVVHGRHSHEGSPRAARRKRIILTRQVAATAPDTSHPNSLLWNPIGATLEQALAHLGVGDGAIAVIGGLSFSTVFTLLFAPLLYVALRRWQMARTSRQEVSEAPHPPPVPTG